MQSNTALMWFRHDLRLIDNPALIAACRHANVIPVLIWSPDEEVPWAPGAASRWWLHHSLFALARDLRTAGSRLIIRRGPSTAFSEIAMLFVRDADSSIFREGFDFNSGVTNARPTTSFEPGACAASFIFETTWCEFASWRPEC